jgi:hypothetical protein
MPATRIVVRFEAVKTREEALEVAAYLGLRSV